MKINSIQNTNVKFTGVKITDKLKGLFSKPQNDTFQKNNSQTVSLIDDPVEKYTITIRQKEPAIKQETRITEQNREEIHKQFISKCEKDIENMYSDIFEKVHLQKSTDSYAKLIEEKLKAIGVNAAFDNDRKTARTVYNAITIAIDKGINIPYQVILFSPIEEDFLGFTPCTQKGYELMAPVFIKKGLSDNNENLAESLKQQGYRHYTDDSAIGTFFHELAHYNHQPKMLDEKTSTKIWKEHFPSFEDELEFAKKVSMHAISDKTGCEFVAEVFAGMIKGETYDNEVMQLYKELNGPIFG